MKAGRRSLSHNGLRLALGLLLLAAPALAEGATPEREDPAVVASAVQQAVSDTVSSNAAITLGPVSGAHYARLHRSAERHGQRGGTHLQAAAHCPTPTWTLYVSVTVDSRMAIVVAARPIAGGQTIAEADLMLREEPLTLYAGRQIYYHPEDVTGSTAILSLPRGTIITGTVIQQRIVVQAGQIIAVDVQNGEVDLTLDAKAEQSGRVGDSIMVTNPMSGKHFQATVTATGAVVQLGP